MMEKTELNLNGLHPSHVFRGGEGLSPYHINCSANPLDLRPAVDITLKAIDDRLATLPEGTPLVVLVGENHDTPAHRVYQQLLASRLLARETDFAVAMEWPHNQLAVVAKEEMGIPVSKGLYYEISALDTDGRGVLSAFMGFGTSIYAPLSKHQVIGFCCHNVIKTIFNDAADINGRTALDLRDPFTAAVGRISTAGPDGMAIRNRVMARRGVDYVCRQGLPIIIQPVGLAHVFGWHDQKVFYEDSLCAAYRKAGAEVLPVFITRPAHSYGLNRLPEEAYPALAGSVLIDGMAENGYNFFSLSRLWGGEKRFIKKLQVESGGGLEFYDVEANKKYWVMPS